MTTSQPPEPPEPPEVDFRRPAWTQPPEDVVPGVAPVELVLARTAERAIGLTGIRAYPNGFACTLHLRLREVIPGEQSLFGMFGMFDMLGELDPAGELGDYYLRLGVGFADGRKATNLDRRRDVEDGPPPDPPALRLTRWEGYDILSQEVDLWVWGLPPPGPLAFVCQWPARRIPESRVKIDAALVLEVARRAEAIWPDEVRQ
jgi:hypothetical protein